MGRCQSLRRDLGITPASYATILRDIGVLAKRQDDAIEQLGRMGEQIRARREAERAARSAET